MSTVKQYSSRMVSKMKLFNKVS